MLFAGENLDHVLEDLRAYLHTYLHLHYVGIPIIFFSNLQHPLALAPRFMYVQVVSVFAPSCADHTLLVVSSGRTTVYPISPCLQYMQWVPSGLALG